MNIAIIGAGWAGLAAAVRATQQAHAVTLFDAAPMPGGRARSDDAGAAATDNGQHILLGGYVRTLALMREVGVDVEHALLRLPLAMTYADGTGFSLSPTGWRLASAASALLSARGFSALDKLSALAMAAAWQLRRFRCPATLTVDQLLSHLPTARVRRLLIEPLCVAALNTAASQASAAVFLAVMRDGLFGARGASDLLLPQRPLVQLLPLPATHWLRERGALVRLRRRVLAIAPEPGGWTLSCGDGERARFDRVILATPPSEAARLASTVSPAWSATAAALPHEPIVTITLQAPSRPWRSAMLALDADSTQRPAQFAFRLGEQMPGVDRATLVVSAAGGWMERGTEAIVAAVLAQYRSVFSLDAASAVECLAVRSDRRATFRCVAGLVRPRMHVAPGLVAAGDYVDGPYPATIEAAVMAGEAAAAVIAQ